MHVTRGRGRRAASVGVGLLLLFQLLSWAAPGSQVSAQDEDGFVDLRGYATGQPAHITALQSGETRVANTEVAWSGASVDADEDGLNGPKLNEVERPYLPAETLEGDTVNGNLSYARGSGLELGVGTTPSDANQLALESVAEQVAPPDNDEPTTNEIALEGAPVAYASLLRGQALANANDSGLLPEVCVVGDDLSRGLGYAADVQLLDTTGGTDSDPNLEAALIALDDQDDETGEKRAVSNSVSRMKLVPNGEPNGYGLIAEVRQTIAPVTLVQSELGANGPELRLITIELLGEWVLRVFSPGVSGVADDVRVHYGPGDVSPETPLIKIIDSEAAEPLLITTQQFFDEAGLQLPAELAQLIQLSVGEDPRAIADPGADPDPESEPTITSDGTKTSAAVDAVRLRLLSQPDPIAADVRIGHMEVSAEVPSGGVECPIPVDKEGDRDTIRIGEEPDSASFTITVHNAFDCDMTDTVLTDNISQEEGDPNFKVTAASPTPESPDIPTETLTDASIVWNLGTIEPGGKKSVEVTIQSANAGGILRDIASATANLANCHGEDASGLGLAGLDISGLSVPVDVAIETPLTGATATRTVATGGALALAAAAAAIVLRRRHGHQT